MKRYGVLRSPYPDKFQARAIELLRIAESGKVQRGTILDTLAEEFQRNKKIYNRLKGAKLSLRVIRRWAKSRPDLPEIMRGETVRSFEQIALQQVSQDMGRMAIHNALVATIDKL